MTDLRLETLEHTVQAIIEKMEEHEDKGKSRMDEILSKLNRLEGQLATSKSFIGGVVFILSCLWAVFTLFKESIFHNLVNK